MNVRHSDIICLFRQPQYITPASTPSIGLTDDASKHSEDVFKHSEDAFKLTEDTFKHSEEVLTPLENVFQPSEEAMKTPKDFCCTSADTLRKNEEIRENEPEVIIRKDKKITHI